MGGVDPDSAHRVLRTGGESPGPSPELIGVVLGLGPSVGEAALDAGCGTGAEAVYLASIGLEVIGVDISPTALAAARERADAAGVAVDLRLGDARELPVDDGSVDFVNDHGLLHHLPAGARPRYAAELARVLRPGGWLLVRAEATPRNRALVAATFGVELFAEVRSLDRTPVGTAGGALGHLALIRRA